MIDDRRTFHAVATRDQADSWRAGLVVFTVYGELDASAVAAIAAQGIRRVGDIGVTFSDLSGVTPIDRAGVRCGENLAAGVAHVRLAPVPNSDGDDQARLVP